MKAIILDEAGTVKEELAEAKVTKIHPDGTLCITAGGQMLDGANPDRVKLLPDGADAANWVNTALAPVAEESMEDRVARLSGVIDRLLSALGKTAMFHTLLAEIDKADTAKEVPTIEQGASAD